jgi:hypothetical protein
MSGLGGTVDIENARFANSLSNIHSCRPPAGEIDPLRSTSDLGSSAQCKGCPSVTGGCSIRSSLLLCIHWVVTIQPSLGKGFKVVYVVKAEIFDPEIEI